MTIISDETVDERARQIPAAALVIGWAGVLPFAAGALALWIERPEAASAFLPFLIYAAIILSFLGGVRWGVAMRLSGADRASSLAQSMVPALIGWTGACLYKLPALAILVLALSHLAAGIADYALAKGGLAPAWYGRLRVQLTAAALIALVVGLAALWTK